MDFEKNRRLYLDLLSLDDKQEELAYGSEHQIELDLNRTIFYKQNQNRSSLQNVLLAYSRYDSTIGYVQGMNHIVYALMIHCSEEVCFWLFVSLIEDY